MKLQEWFVARASSLMDLAVAWPRKRIRCPIPLTHWCAQGQWHDWSDRYQEWNPSIGRGQEEAFINDISFSSVRPRHCSRRISLISSGSQRENCHFVSL